MEKECIGCGELIEAVGNTQRCIACKSKALVDRPRKWRADNKTRVQHQRLEMRHNKIADPGECITETQMISLLRKHSCVYCGLKSTSITRIDPTKGFVIENCQTVCTMCGLWKWNYSEEEFKHHVEVVYAFQNRDQPRQILSKTVTVPRAGAASW